ncbi:MAG: hypothetical protein GY929_21615 [Actinomycetia bacterium]|nr:hypothetical protein [Actinomycetes bacterium]MCP5028880.1 hypothetical protein [Actinomycetes bacterium]
MNRLETVSFTALNLPEHATNPIHTDDGARAAGFPRALVAGVSVFAYMTHVPMAAWGRDWLAGGGSEVWFRSPVFDLDTLDCVPDELAAGWSVAATVEGQLRSEAHIWASSADDPAGPLERRTGTTLDAFEVELDDRWIGYGDRLGEATPLYSDIGLVHPASWPSLANSVMHDQVVDGSWIHTRSRIHHVSEAYRGEIARVEGTVFDRFDTRVGERALVDFVITANGRTVAEIEHEAIVRVHAN